MSTQQRLSEEEIRHHLSRCEPGNRWWLEPYLRGDTDPDGDPIPTEEHLS